MGTLSVLTAVGETCISVNQDKFQEQLKQCLDIFHTLLLEK